jgi:formate/nitrite transporter FocA (FNT family)
MEEIHKTTKIDVIAFCFMTFFSGAMIGIGGTASLLANNLFGAWGRLIGACLFSLGIYMIVTYEMRLFTGMVADIPKMGVKNFWKLPVCFIGNALGVALIALLVMFSPLASNVVEQGATLIEKKLLAETWYINVLCSSILCGMLITLSVWAVRYAPKKGLNATVGVLFPIVVFAFCGFDHSVANMLYLTFYGQITWQIVGYVLISIIGNIIGGVMLPVVMLWKEKMKAVNI